MRKLFFTLFLCVSVGLTMAQSDVLFYESFDQCVGYGTPGESDYEDMGYTGGNDGQWSGNIATGVILPDNNNWSSDYAYGAFQCAKVGHSKYAGYVTTPSISCTGDITLTFRAAPWGSDSLMDIKVTGGTPDKAAFTLKKNQWNTLTVQITDVSSNVRIQFYSLKKHRFFLDDVTLLPPDPTAAVIRSASGSLVDFGYLSCDYKKQNQNIYITGKNLKTAISVALTGDDASRFGISTTSLPAEGGKLTVAFNAGAPEGRYGPATLQLSATGNNNEKVTKNIYLGVEVGSLMLEGSGTKMDPYTISDVILLAAHSTVFSGDLYWVKGYVLGAVKRYNTDKFDGVCTNDKTSLVLAKTAGETDYNKIITVELNAGDARNALNVVENPELIGQMIKVRGYLLNSKGYPNYLEKPGVHGVKNNDQYVRPWDQEEAEEYEPTGLGKAQRDKTQCIKFIQNGQLFILYNGTKYNIQGQEVQP